MIDLDATKDRTDAVVDDHAELLLDASHRIHARPELGFAEHHAHDVLTGVLTDAGLDVTTGAYGLDTAFEARAGNGGPTIAVL
ncbi:MAG: M20 family peptidase, partial [Acidimicrobiales bacterium]